MSLQLRQGTNAERLTITPVSGEPIWTTDTHQLYVGDGSTVGGLLITTTSTGSAYVLTTATSETLGGVKIGSGIEVAADGTISVTTSSGTGGANTGDFTFTGSQIVSTVTTTILADTGDTIFSNPFGVVIVGTSGGAVKINGNTGQILMPNQGKIRADSGHNYDLENVNSITFQDGSRLSSSDVGVSTSTLINGTSTVVLGSTGTVSLPGNIELPLRNLQADYNATATSVSGISVVISAGDYPIPQAGWLYNGYTIESVTGLSGNYQLNFGVSLPFGTGTYVLRAYPGAYPSVIKFSDGSVQTTAYTGGTAGTGTIDLSTVAQSVAPITDITYDIGAADKQWRRLYVGSNGVYIDGKSVGINTSNQITIDGTPAVGGTSTVITTSPADDFTWTPPLAGVWRTVTFTGTFAGSYTQDITSNTLSTTSTNTGSNLTEVLISRLSYPNIDNVLPAYNKITIDGADITSIVSGIRLDRYPDDAVINIATGSSVSVYDTSTIVIQYTTTGSGNLVWFDFANTPDSGVGLLGGEIKYQATVEMNDGTGITVGKSGALNFNNAADQFDQTGFVFGPSTGTAVCSYTEYNSATGFSYKTNLGLGEIDRVKVMWKATLFYNGTWF